MSDLRKLIEESKQAPPLRPRAPMYDPSGNSARDFMFRRSKMPNAAQADAQHAYFYDKLLEELGHPTSPGVKPPAWKDLNPAIADSLLAYAEDKDGFRTSMQSPQESTGVLGSGSPVNTALTWIQSMPGMLYGAGQMVGNAADYAFSSGFGAGGAMGETELMAEPAVQYPDAAQRTMAAVDTFTAPGQEIARRAGYGPEENRSAWTAMQKTKEKNDEGIKPFEAVERLLYEPTPYGSRISDIQHNDNLSKEAQATRVMLDGQEYLESMRVPEFVAAPAGMLLDDIFNPLLGAPGGKSIPHLVRWAATEFLPSQAMLGIGAAANYMQKSKEQQMDELIGRLGNK